LSDAKVTAPQIIGWVVTGLGIFVSFGWNLVNHLRTNASAKKLRGEQYALSQWSRIRGMIDQALDGLVGASKAIVQQVQQLDENDPSNVQIDIFNQLMIDAQDELASALEEAALSPYSEGVHWRGAANGPLTGTETAWDRILTITEEARASTTKKAKIDALKNMRIYVQQIRTLIADYCRAQDINLEP